MQALDPKPYIVRPGDTVTSIAKQFGFVSWADIYRSPANAAFRARRPNPDQIQVGDRIMIPAAPGMVRQVLQQRLNSLVALRSATEGLYQGIEQELDQNIRNYDNVAKGADAVSTVATVLVSLGSLVVKGMAAMKLSSSALEVANKELSKDALKFAVDPLEDPTLKFTAGKIGANAGVVWLVGKVTIESWLNINSPSWWAGVVGNLQDGKSWSQAVTTSPEDALQATRDQIEAQRVQTLNRIDQKIRETRTLLYGVAANGLTSLYDQGMGAYA